MKNIIWAPSYSGKTFLSRRYPWLWDADDFCNYAGWSELSQAEKKQRRLENCQALIRASDQLELGHFLATSAKLVPLSRIALGWIPDLELLLRRMEIRASEDPDRYFITPPSLNRQIEIIEEVCRGNSIPLVHCDELPFHRLSSADDHGYGRPIQCIKDVS